MLKKFAGRNIIQSEDKWKEWLNKLSHGDKCLYQEFVPLELGVLGSNVECFRYWPALFLGGCVRYNNEVSPIKEGIGVFWGSTNPIGKVFPGRIIPWIEELTSPLFEFADSDRPVFEPGWWGDRCYLIVSHGSGFSKRIIAADYLLKDIPHYQRDVNNGVLFTCFHPSEILEMRLKENEESGLKFLYSECLR